MLWNCGPEQIVRILAAAHGKNIVRLLAKDALKNLKIESAIVRYAQIR